MITETTLEVIDVNLYNAVKKPREYIPNFLRVNSASFFSKSAVYIIINNRKNG
jgi:hypothetical protein